MKPLSLDTSAEAQDLIFEMLGRASTSKKLALTFELTQTTRLMVLAGVRRRFPNADESELRRRLIAKLLSREDVICAYGFDPNADML
jgi:hypothetical protein